MPCIHTHTHTHTHLHAPPLQYGSPDPRMVARVRNLTAHAHARGLEFYIYKGDQASQFNWTRGWMELQAPGETPPYPVGNGFCPSSPWGALWDRYTRAFLEATQVHGLTLTHSYPYLYRYPHSHPHPRPRPHPPSDLTLTLALALALIRDCPLRR